MQPPRGPTEARAQDGGHKDTGSSPQSGSTFHLRSQTPVGAPALNPLLLPAPLGRGRGRTGVKHSVQALLSQDLPCCSQRDRSCPLLSCPSEKHELHTVAKPWG